MKTQMFSSWMTDVQLCSGARRTGSPPEQALYPNLYILTPASLQARRTLTQQLQGRLCTLPAQQPAQQPSGVAGPCHGPLAMHEPWQELRAAPCCPVDARALC